MITYEAANSPFFQANKFYCEQIERNLNAENIACSGFCNSYGYTVNAAFVRNNLSFNMLFEKFQSTRNGVVIPVDAHDYAGVELTVAGLRKSVEVSIGQNSWKRLFTEKKFTEKIPSPYYVKMNYSPAGNMVTNVFNKIMAHKISKLTLRKGVLTCKIHAPTTNPLALISDIEVMTAKWM